MDFLRSLHNFSVTICHDNHDRGPRIGLIWQMQKLTDTFIKNRFAPLRYAPLRYAPLRYAPLRYAPLRYAPLRYAPLRYATIMLDVAHDGYIYRLTVNSFFLNFYRSNCLNRHQSLQFGSARRCNPSRFVTMQYDLIRSSRSTIDSVDRKKCLNSSKSCYP